MSIHTPRGKRSVAQPPSRLPLIIAGIVITVVLAAAILLLSSITSSDWNTSHNARLPTKEQIEKIPGVVVAYAVPDTSKIMNYTGRQIERYDVRDDGQLVRTSVEPTPELMIGPYYKIGFMDIDGEKVATILAHHYTGSEDTLPAAIVTDAEPFILVYLDGASEQELIDYINSIGYRNIGPTINITPP